MLDKIRIENILFLDIETVPAFSEYSELPNHLQKLWDLKARSLSRYHIRFEKDAEEYENKTPEELYERAGIYAEFGKIICISAGYIKAGYEFRTTSFYGDDEKEL